MIYKVYKDGQHESELPQSEAKAAPSALGGDRLNVSRDGHGKKLKVRVHIIYIFTQTIVHITLMYVQVFRFPHMPRWQLSYSI